MANLLTIKKVLISVLICILTIAIVKEANCQIEWVFFEEVVFDVIDDIIKSIDREDLTNEKIASLQESLSNLEILLEQYRQQETYPSQEVYQSIQYIIAKAQNVITSYSTNSNSIEEQKMIIAFLRQALYSYQIDKKTPTDIPSLIENSTFLNFSIGFFYRSHDSTDVKTLIDGGVMHSGDRYKIIFTPSEDCYVYIFQIDSSGRIYSLFPMESFGNVTLKNFNPVKRWKSYHIPDRDKSFVLDNQIGIEKIYFLASREADSIMEDQYQKILTAQHSGDIKENLAELDRLISKLTHTIENKRPVAINVNHVEESPVIWQEDGQTFSAFLQRIEQMGNNSVHVLTFIHR